VLAIMLTGARKIDSANGSQEQNFFRASDVDLGTRIASARQAGKRMGW